MITVNEKKVGTILNKIIAHELSGVNRYAHYTMVVSGLERLSLVNYFKGHATESLDHALKAGELLTGLNGHPTLNIENTMESNKHDLVSILNESIAHETEASKLYRKLLEAVQGHSVYLEDYARDMIGQEELHVLDMRKLLRKAG